jgi:hypothetical protein
LDLLPFRFLDRGLALENTWIASWRSIGLPADTRLSSLVARDPGDGKLLRSPGVMFNATSMTTGERLIFGTTIPTRPISDEASLLQSAVVQRAADGTRTPEYEPLTQVQDIRIVTAARLSATFPLVTPAARCRDCDGLRQYVVDGGYVDNSGVESLTEWLEALLSDEAMQDVSATVVQIVPFSEDECEKKREQRWAPSQMAVPLRTLYSVRGAGQARNSINDLVDLRREFATQERPGRVCLHSFAYDNCFDRHGFNPPLSWHLTAGQAEEVQLSWTDEDREEAQKVVREALSEGSATCYEGTVQPSREAPQMKPPARKL